MASSPESVSDEARRPSWLRLLAASYIDFMLLSACVFFVEAAGGGHARHVFLTAIAFLILVPMVVRTFGRSVGHRVMGIYQNPEAHWQWLVDPDVDRRTNRLWGALVMFLFYSAHHLVQQGFLNYDSYFLANQRLLPPASHFLIGGAAVVWFTGAYVFSQGQIAGLQAIIVLQTLLVVNALASLPLLQEVAAQTLEKAGTSTTLDIDPTSIMWFLLAADIATLMVLVVAGVAYRHR